MLNFNWKIWKVTKVLTSIYESPSQIRFSYFYGWHYIMLCHVNYEIEQFILNVVILFLS